VEGEAKTAGSIGGVYWHEQDEEGFRECGKMCIGFVTNPVHCGTLVLERLVEEGKIQPIESKTRREKIPKKDMRLIDKEYGKESDETAKKIATMAVEAIKAEGLEVSWNGKTGQKINIQVMRKR